jgi:hypothetical protein
MSKISIEVLADVSNRPRSLRKRKRRVAGTVMGRVV